MRRRRRSCLGLQVAWAESMPREIPPLKSFRSICNLLCWSEGMKGSKHLPQACTPTPHLATAAQTHTSSCQAAVSSRRTVRGSAPCILSVELTTADALSSQRHRRNYCSNRNSIGCIHSLLLECGCRLTPCHTLRPAATSESPQRTARACLLLLASRI